MTPSNLSSNYGDVKLPIFTSVIPRKAKRRSFGCKIDCSAGEVWWTMTTASDILKEESVKRLIKWF